MAGDEEVLRLLRGDRHGWMDETLTDSDLGLSDEDLYRGEWGTAGMYDREELQRELEGNTWHGKPLYSPSTEASELAYEAVVRERLAALMQQYPQELPHRLLAMALQ
jgi:hypothetical protein